MIKILIVDDNPVKARKISELLNSIPGCKLEIAPDLVTARRLLQNPFDLLILDMNLPERFNETPKENNGMAFIDEIKKTRRLRLPPNIIGLSEYEDLVEKYNKEFSDQALLLIKYDNTGTEWQKILKERVEHLLQSDIDHAGGQEYGYDIAFICALRTPEFDTLLEMPYNWEKIKIPNDSSIYYKGVIILNDSTSLNVIASYLPQMGMVSTAMSATKMLLAFKPKYLIMTGICGGIKGKVKLGDIIISDSSFDYGSGKMTKTEDGHIGFEPDYKSIPLSGDFKEELIDLTQQKSVLREIKDSWKGAPFSGEMNLVIGAVGSGAAVIANSDYMETVIAHQRKLVAIDMETYAVFYCCELCNLPRPIALSIKGVCDYADHEKNDDIQKYASHISVKMAEYVIKHILNF